MSQQAFLDISK